MAGRVYNYANSSCNSHATDASNVGVLVGFVSDSDLRRFAGCASVSNVDIVLSCGESGSGGFPQGDISAASRAIQKGVHTNRGIVNTGCVIIERTCTIRRIVIASVLEKCLKTRGSVTVTSFICKKGRHTGGCITVAVCVKTQRTITRSGIHAAVTFFAFSLEGKSPGGRVIAAGRVNGECLITVCRVLGTGRVGGECNTSGGVEDAGGVA